MFLFLLNKSIRREKSSEHTAVLNLDSRLSKSVIGFTDYIKKNYFSKVALERVERHGIEMRSRYFNLEHYVVLEQR